MAIEGVVANSGSGGTEFAIDNVSGGSGTVAVPYVKLMSGADTSAALIGGDATNGLDVDVTRVSGTVTVDGSGVTQPVSGTVTANMGTVTADPFGANADAASATGSISAKLRFIAATGIPITSAVITGGAVSHDGAAGTVKPLLIGAFASAAAPTDVSADGDAVQTWALRSGAIATQPTYAGILAVAGNGASGTGVQRVTVANDSTGILAGVTTVTTVTTVSTITGGGVAHDGADSGNPIKVGGRAINAEIAAVANNDRADFVTDLVGKQIVMPYANPENFVSGAITTAMTGTTSTSLIGAPAAGLRNYITQITVSCAHATQGTDVVIQDGNGGATLYTIPAAALYGGAAITFPVPLRQPTTATAIFCANVTTGSSTKVSASGYKGA